MSNIVEPTRCISSTVEALHQTADDGDPAVVTLRLTFGDGAKQEVYLTPESARELAESLNLAADDSEG